MRCSIVACVCLNYSVWFFKNVYAERAKMRRHQLFWLTRWDYVRPRFCWPVDDIDRISMGRAVDITGRLGSHLNFRVAGRAKAGLMQRAGKLHRRKTLCMRQNVVVARKSEFMASPTCRTSLFVFFSLECCCLRCEWHTNNAQINYILM